MVEEGEASFDRMRHRDPVSLRREDVPRQEAACLEILSARQRMPRIELARQALAQLGERVVTVDRLAQLARIELADTPRQREARQVREKRIVARIETRAEERFQVGSGLRLQAAEVRIQAAQEERAPFRLRLPRPEAGDFPFSV